MIYISGNNKEVRGHMRYSGSFIAGPQNTTARMAAFVLEPQGAGKLNEDNPMLLKANQSVEILFDGTIAPHSHLVEVQVNDELHEAGIVRARTTVEPGNQYRLFFTAQRNVDLSKLEWIIEARIIRQIK